MSSLANYFTASAEAKAAKHLYDYASVNLENKRIKERLAEIISQAEPLDAISNGSNITRNKMIKVAEYVVIGRKIDA